MVGTGSFVEIMERYKGEVAWKATEWWIVPVGADSVPEDDITAFGSGVDLDDANEYPIPWDRVPGGVEAVRGLALEKLEKQRSATARQIAAVSTGSRERARPRGEPEIPLGPSFSRLHVND